MADQHNHDIKIPTGVLIGFGLLLAGIIAAVAFFRYSGQEPLAQVPEPANILEQRQLRFVDGGNGTVEVLQVRPGEADTLIHLIEPGDGGFIRGVLRSMARARRASGISEEAPFVVIQLANGTVLLEDPATQQRIDLQAFGPASIEAFQVLLGSAD